MCNAVTRRIRKVPRFHSAVSGTNLSNHLGLEIHSRTEEEIHRYAVSILRSKNYFITIMS